MLHYPPANRETEFELFKQIISGQTKERILLLEAAGGLGKTTLLSEFMRRCPGEVCQAPVDLKGNNTGLHQIFYRLCDALDPDWKYFPAFTARVEGLGQVTIADNKIIGRADIAIALQSPDEGNRAARRADLTRAFFTDLRAMQRRLLLIFDTFDEAPLEVQEWLQSSFLAFARRTPDLMVIVAGRQVPVENIEWAACCICHRLLPVREPEPWHIYAERMGAVLPSPEWIAAFCDLLDGHPLEIAKALARYVPAGGP